MMNKALVRVLAEGLARGLHRTPCRTFREFAEQVYTVTELAELRELQARTYRGGLYPNDQWDFSELTDAELDRFGELVTRIDGYLLDEPIPHGRE